MSSRLNEVVLSSAARQLILALPGREQRRLLLALTRLKKDARPPESRALLGKGPEAREWLESGFKIVYYFYPQAHRVEIGIIRPAG